MTISESKLTIIQQVVECPYGDNVYNGICTHMNYSTAAMVTDEKRMKKYLIEWIRFRATFIKRYMVLAWMTLLGMIAIGLFLMDDIYRYISCKYNMVTKRLTSMKKEKN